MSWSYQYTPHLWPVWTSAVFLMALGGYGVRRRAAPGALALAVMIAWALAWVLANGLELAGTDDATRIFWFKVQATLVLPMAVAQLCFVVEYAGLGKWLTGRTLALLAVPPLAFALLASTNGIHHLVWTRIFVDGGVHGDRGPAHWVAIGYGYLLSLLHLAVLAWLFARSPGHRWIAAGLIVASLGMRGASFLNVIGKSPVAPLNPMVLVLNFTLIPYAYAILRFRMLDVVPVARHTAVEWMADGLVALDVENRVADINKTARALLGIHRSRGIGEGVEKVLEACPELLDFVRSSRENECEMSLGGGDRRHRVFVSPIVDRRGFRIGRLVTFHDITERERARARLLDQERTLAMLKEREWLARELHDGIGQVAAAAHMQAEVARELLARGDVAQAESCLRSIAQGTREIKESVGDYLAGIKARSSSDCGFFDAIRRYIDRYGRQYGIRAEWIAPPEWEERDIDSTIGAQLQPIVQEALINARKHAGARSVRVAFTPRESGFRVAIEDDGRGFDPEGAGEGFGLRAMRGRAEALGGSLKIASAPGRGTLVTIEVPWRKEKT